MRAIALKSYSAFREAIPDRFRITKGPQKGDRVADFREAVGTEALRFRLKHMSTTGDAAHRHTRWKTWFEDVAFHEDTWKILHKIDDDTISALKKDQANIEYYIAIYYRFHAVLNDMSFADAIDELVFEGPLRDQADPVFIKDAKPTAPFIHPPYVPADDVRQRLENDPTDGIWLNPYNHHSIKLSGREREKAHLDAFMARDEKFLICPVIGPSGSGKTRLVSEWMKLYAPSVSATDWDAGFVISREVEPWTKWSITRDTLIVIDYTFAYDDVVRLIALRGRTNRSGRKIRLLVIDHVFPKELFNDTFWQGLYKTRALAEGNYGELYRTLELRPEGSQSKLLRDVAAAVANTGGGEFDSDHPLIKDAVSALFRMGEPSAKKGGRGNPDAVRHPLFAALLGHAVRLGRDFSHWSRRDVIDYYFSNADRLPWKTWNEGGRKGWGIAVGALVSAATLRRGLPVRQVMHMLPGEPEALIQYANRIVSSEVGAVLIPFEPDILGEAFLLKFLKSVRNDEEAYRLFISIFVSGRDDVEMLEIANNFREAIARLARNLANDDQALAAVEDGWDAICDFLRPERFEHRSPMRLTVSFTIVDVMEWLAAVTEFLMELAGQNRYATIGKIEHLLVRLGDVRANLENQFCEGDVMEACAKEKSMLSATLAAFRFFEFSDGSISKTNREFLSRVIKATSPRHTLETTATIFAAANGYMRVLNLIGDSFEKRDALAPDIFGRRPLEEACRNGQTEAAGVLLDWDADQVNHLEWNWHGGRTALIAACENGHTATAALLLDRDAEVNQAAKDGTTALMAACEHGHATTAALLLDNDALVNMAAIDGWTALIAACENGHTATAALLLDRDAEVNQAANDGWTELLIADLSGRVKTPVSHLIDRMAPDGQTALILASQKGHAETVSLLLDWDAEVNLCMSDGRTALDHALESRHLEISELLRRAGAKTGEELDADCDG